MPGLFEPFLMLGGTAKNRIALAPLTRGRCGEAKTPNALHVEYYGQRSGAGLLISEATAVSPEGYAWVGAPAIYDREMAEAWRPVIDEVHRRDSLIVCQLWHAGRAGHSDFLDGRLPPGPSAVKIRSDYVHTPEGKKTHETPVEMTQSDINAVVDSFAKATRLAREVGFDGVELHGANGYLINQFIDPCSNRREDQYGGSNQNRFRFLGEIVDACVSEWSSTRIAVRLSPNGVYNDMGHEGFHDTYRYVAQCLNERNLAYLHLMDGVAFGFHGKDSPMSLADFLPLFDGPIIGNCGYTPETAARAVQDGLADMISFGRPFISNPDLPHRIKNNIPLRLSDDPSFWYTAGSRGYTDYPVDA